MKDRTGVSLSCPALDSAIAGIEEARSINDDLRFIANSALEDVENLRAEITSLEDELSQYV